MHIHVPYNPAIHLLSSNWVVATLQKLKFGSTLYSIQSVLHCIIMHVNNNIITSCFYAEEQLRADLEAAKALSKAGTDPQVHAL